MTRMVALMLMAVLGLAACETKKDKPAVVTSGVVNLGPASDFPAGSANTNFVAKYGIVVTNTSGTPLAIWPQCTYGAATVKWDEAREQFVCPMHGCHYDLLGRPTRGPATKPLQGVATQREADGTLTVDLSRLHGM